MATDFREEFLRERENVANLDDPDVADALTQFADALDPERPQPQVPKPRANGTIDHADLSHSTARNYLQKLRRVHECGLNLLDVDADAFNEFMYEVVTDPAERRNGVVDYDGTIEKSSARHWQSAAIAFYRFCTAPNHAADRPDVHVAWPADEIIRFADDSDPKHDEADMLEDAEVDALREACLRGKNPRRDRAFLELLAGTCQRRYAIATLRVKHVNLDADVPHILLNPEIAGDGDKNAIENTGRWKPIVSDPVPIREWLRNHPLRDADTRAEHGAPDEFEECYLFVGDLSHWHTDASDHWDAGAAGQMLDRLKDRTASMPNVPTVEKPVNPHNWRHWAYTKAKDLPIDESKRRKVFGWSKDSDTGDTTYGHVENEQAAREFADAWRDVHGEGDSASVSEQVVGAAAAGDLSPEAKQALVQELASDPDVMGELAKATTEYIEEQHPLPGAMSKQVLDDISDEAVILPTEDAPDADTE